MVKTEQTGLYDATNEHDACGVGMVVNIHGNKSHELVDSALKVLENMRHRGAEGADNKTGDARNKYREFQIVQTEQYTLSPSSCKASPYPKKENTEPDSYFCPKTKKSKPAS